MSCIAWDMPSNFNHGDLGSVQDALTDLNKNLTNIGVIDYNNNATAISNLKSKLPSSMSVGTTYVVCSLYYQLPTGKGGTPTYTTDSNGNNVISSASYNTTNCFIRYDIIITPLYDSNTGNTVTTPTSTNTAISVIQYTSPNTTFNQNALNYSQLTNYANSSVQIYNSSPSFEFGMTSNNISQNAITLSTPNGSNNTGYVDLALFPIGTKDISGNLLNATVIFCGWLYSNGTTYTQTAVTLISNLIDMALKHYYISGKITDSNNNALVRKVRVYDKTTGYMLTETLSNSDGTYSLTVHQNTPMYVVCIHDSSDSNNSQILDDIIPYSN